MIVPPGFSAITFGNNIYFKEGAYNIHSVNGVALIGHEVQHGVQYASQGTAAFLWFYGALSLIHGYEDNPLEVEARKKETRIFEELSKQFGKTGDPCK